MSDGAKAPATLYFGHVMHARSRPARHSFTYRVFSMLLDIDALDDVNRQSFLFSVGRFNLFSFFVRDHGARDGGSLRTHIEGLLSNAGLGAPDRIMLLCYPRILGYVFNPLSVYYCYSGDGTLTALVYQVHNTFGDAHSYVAPVMPDERAGRMVRQSRGKNLHVSPFVGMAAAYHFTLDDPGTHLGVHISEADGDGPFLLATFDGEARPFTTGNLMRAFVRYPLMTVKIIGAIHFEALRLWRKGVPYFARPETAPEPASADGPSKGARGNAIDPAKAPEKGYSNNSVTKAA